MPRKSDASKDMYAELLAKQKASDDKFDKMLDMVHKLSEKVASIPENVTGNKLYPSYLFFCLLS